MNGHSVGSELLIDYKPHCPEPEREGGVSAMKYRSSQDPYIVPALGAFKTLSRAPHRGVLAFWASNAARPSNFGQVVSAGLLGAEPGLEIQLVLGVIFHVRKYSTGNVDTSTDKVVGKGRLDTPSRYP